MARVAINGFGRIGRAVCRLALAQANLDLVAINDLMPDDNLGYLFEYDTVYGRSEQAPTVSNGYLQVGDARCRLLHERDPVDLPWKELDVDLVFECTGVFDAPSELQKHRTAGARFVLLSAPSKSPDIPMVVHGVNQAGDVRNGLLSCASCTTNAVAPICEVLSRRIGVRKAIMTTVHAYTASQGLVDAPSDKWRRGRAAAANIIPTTTGAARATADVLPAYLDKFDGVALRVPVAAGSLADLVCVMERQVTAEEINRCLSEESRSLRYHGILRVTTAPIVSADILQDPHAAIVDAGMTQVVDGDLVKVVAWYDNEWGYANQVVREALRLVDAHA